MRKILVVVWAIVLVVPLVFALPVAAEPNQPVTCDIEFELNFAKSTYEGWASNCVYAGYAESFVIEAVFPGPTPDVPFSGNLEHWVGVTEIFPGCYEPPCWGNRIVILEKGVWNFNDRNPMNNPDPRCSFDVCLKYRTNGEVVDRVVLDSGEVFATTGFDDLIGAKSHGMGYTSEFPIPPFLAEQTVRIHR